MFTWYQTSSKCIKLEILLWSLYYVRKIFVLTDSIVVGSVSRKANLFSEVRCNSLQQVNTSPAFQTYHLRYSEPYKNALRHFCLTVSSVSRLWSSRQSRKGRREEIMANLWCKYSYLERLHNLGGF